MFMQAYSFLDTKTGLYSLPFFMGGPELACRAAFELASDGSTTIGKYPDDFVLVNIGEFDDNTARLIAVPPVSMGNVAAIVARFLSARRRTSEVLASEVETER